MTLVLLTSSGDALYLYQVFVKIFRNGFERTRQEVAKIVFLR